jgi:glycosyltransferase involved in cell wall biosynthesis
MVQTQGLLSVRLLLIHQNFPGQFRQLAPCLQQRGHDLVAICSHERPVALQARMLRYGEPTAPPASLPLGPLLWWEGLERASRVARLCAQLEAEGWRPDRILAHCGWGETLGIRQVWPQVPQLLWPELWLLPEHGGYGLDPTKPQPGLDQHLEQLGRNALTRVALDQAEAWVLPTRHQANSFPPEFQGPRLHVVHEGIDTTLAAPDPAVSLVVRGITITRATPTLTFVNRNLERLRGFDVFMRALPQIMTQRPDLRVLIVGGNDKGYGDHHPSGRPLREVMLAELAGQLDLERIHFLGRIPHPQLLALLQASWVHVYLSYPFVMGWSLLEAMACGCAIVASQGMPVHEVIEHGVQGLLVPHNDPVLLARRVLTLLADESLRQRLGQAARSEALNWDQRQTLPHLVRLVEA